ncbi:phage tail protein [Verminephrobacter aporrectodeae subsp. tuberculatae]|uniref:phage tail protein n=1 Tax=Verminephrobacter aporrectodeae TaxID=1110389 RepID=UPI002243697E|nr:phage tail protein [Verminephrobacter aporrectodeae]MCW8199284.1 phage tail protein [Verminephrobacter aporrectodeae subsp. tuberculatae]MCW8207645.1 phage tail protein [Verminephrobacter aporrectodeae subsp. tuberculatae]
MMMSLGQFMFGMGTLAFEELSRKTAWRHPSNARIGQWPARQFVGPGDDTINLTGLQVPEFAGRRECIAQLRDMGDSGRAWALVSGAGEVFGAWVIESLNASGVVFIREGVARRVQFDLQLARVDDCLADSSGGVNADEVWPVDWWS